MFRLALRGLVAHKLRAGLTAIAILFGVAMIAGTLMLSDSVNRSFDDIFATASEGIDVSVRATQEIETGFDLPEAGAALPEDLIDDVECASTASPAPSAPSATDRRSRSSTRTATGSAPRTAGRRTSSTASSPSRSPPTRISRAAPPQADDEVAIDSFTTDEEGYEIGDTITITGARGRRASTPWPGSPSSAPGCRSAGASLVEMTLPEAQRVTDKEGEFDEIAVEAADGVSSEELRDRINEALPDTAEAKTGEQIADDDSQEIKDGFGFLTTALLIFAGITIFVGAFLIFNIFSITVAQRTREFGMLRTLGASSRQVLTTVIGEAFIDRPDRLGDRDRRRRRLRQAAARRLQGTRLRAAAVGPADRAAHGDHRDRRRHALDARLGADPGASRDPRHPARGAAGGRWRRPRGRQPQAHRRRLAARRARRSP